MIIKMILLLLIKLASIPAQLLPLHEPIAWPDMSWVTTSFAMLDILTPWIHWPFVLMVAGLVLLLVFTELVYDAWRVMLGFIPTFK